MDELQVVRTLLSRVDPPAEEVVRRQRELLMSTIQSTVRSTSPTAEPRGRPRRRALALVGAPVAALGLAAAGWVALQEDATEAANFACVADGVTAVLPNDGTSPVDACADLWASGGMVAGVGAAPALAACIDGGNVVVIVADDGEACQHAGMSAWADQPAFEALGVAVRDARIGFHDRFLATGDGCTTAADWRNGLLGRSGASDVVLDAGTADEGDCLDIASIDPTTLVVTLVAVPGDHSIGCDPRTGC